MNEQEWDARYAEKQQIWSGKPNVALVAQVADLPPGTALDLGAGEGADAIWLARRGWRVTAVDISRVALGRAAEHAAEAGVTVDWRHHDLAESFPEGEYDLVSAQFLHFWDNPAREKVLRRAVGAVAPGGILLIEGHLDHGPFHPEHGHLHFPSPAEVIDALELGEDWTTLVCEAHPREQVGPDGEPATRTDSTVKLRRGAGPAGAVPGGGAARFEGSARFGESV
jgi:SAM-dependent methyltransferase